MNDTSAPSSSLVVLLHGYAAHRMLLSPLSRRLSHAGFATINWGYPSIRKSIRWVAARFTELLDDLEGREPSRPIHLVGHSMGAIVIRAALASRPTKGDGRIVMLTPPNRGSHAADRLAPVLGWCSPPLRELQRDPDSLVNRIPLDCTARADVGIVRATCDWIVCPEDSLLPDARDVITIRGTHSTILWQRETAIAVENFLRSGRFRDRKRGTEESATHQDTLRSGSATRASYPLLAVPDVEL